ncbi:MAG TPA: hypothetical protein VJN93_09595 [Candidatus Acidoferrum sp.]|nr:hypothetical protein [Candidatus Acidoferrum sp.]
MQRAAIGFRVHSGWAALVVLTLERAEPLILIRRKLQLVKTFTYTFRQPYHTAEKMELAEASAFVRMVEKESFELALAGILEVRKELEHLRYSLRSAALLAASGRKLPEFQKILSSHALIHTADGELFRASIRRACTRAKVPLNQIPERELMSIASQRLKKRPEFLNRQVAALGKSLGPPWTQDEKLSTLAAWLTLVS